MAPVNSFLDAIAHKDKAGMLAQTTPHMEVMIDRGGELRSLTIDALADKVASLKGKAAEPIHNPILHIDNDVAVAWTPYQFTLDGEVSNCGTDVFTLEKINGKWLIVGLAYNSNQVCK